MRAWLPSTNVLGVGADSLVPVWSPRCRLRCRLCCPPVLPPCTACRFMANLVLVQYIEQGPLWLAQLLQFVPSFNLYRGLYELSQVRAE